MDILAEQKINADLLRPLPFSQPFDCVLVDAPCSGLGTLRRDPDIKWRRQEAELAGLARPFARGSRRARTFSGMGIGLYLARLVVEGHGGSLTLASPGEDQGTTVTMKLPREGPSSQSVPEEGLEPSRALRPNRS